VSSGIVAYTVTSSRRQARREREINAAERASRA